MAAQRRPCSHQTLQPPTSLIQRQQRRIPSRRRGVDGRRAFADEAQQVVRAAGLGAGAGQTLAAEGLDADEGASIRGVRAKAADLNLTWHNRTLGHQAIHHRVHQTQLKRRTSHLYDLTRSPAGYATRCVPALHQGQASVRTAIKT
jgi:hypothetical protein